MNEEAIVESHVAAVRNLRHSIDFKLDLYGPSPEEEQALLAVAEREGLEWLDEGTIGMMLVGYSYDKRTTRCVVAVGNVLMVGQCTRHPNDPPNKLRGEIIALVRAVTGDCNRYSHRRTPPPATQHQAPMVLSRWDGTNCGVAG